MNKTKINKLLGFSMPEVIIVTACLAVIGSLAFGDVNRLFVKQSVEQEKLDLKEIEKALEIYAKKEGKMPTDETLCILSSETAVSGVKYWNVELAKYATLSSDRICLDQFGNKREYLNYEDTENFRGGSYSFKVYYSSVISGSVNDEDDSIPGHIDTADWSGVSGANGFDKYTGLEDDLVIKYTDRQEKIDKYEISLQRIETLEQYLERYARSKRAAAMSLDIPQFDRFIMYPKDARSGVDTGDYFETAENSEISSELSVETLGESLKATALTKILGLPEYMGRNAITGNTMWYISNPGPDYTKPCTGSKNNPPFYPPTVIMTTNDTRPTDC